jgi:hypothetical protein
MFGFPSGVLALIRRLACCRRSAVSVLFAIAVIPILGFCGLAVDYGIWAEINSNLATSVNVAALNAVKIAASGFINHDPNYRLEGVAAGEAWFASLKGSTTPMVSGGNIVIAITGDSAITATATFSGATINSIFGRIFGTNAYYFDVTASATINTASYLQVVVMLDNSSSMDIAATVAGMNQLMTLSACDPTNAFYPPANQPNAPTTAWVNESLVTYDDYAQAYGAATFDGTYVGALPTILPLNPPVADPVSVFGFPAAVPNEYPTGTLVATAGQAVFPTQPWTPDHVYGTSWNTGQTCQGVLPPVVKNGSYPLPGPPCAFACHWTNTPVQAPQGSPNGIPDPRRWSNDLYGLARRNNIPLRFDFVKDATNTTLDAMKKDNNTAVNNLSVGIYTFESVVHPIYPGPGAGEAGSDFDAAKAAVGLPPVAGDVADTGIQPTVGGLTGNNDDTAFPEDMKSLATSYVTAAGDGTTAAAPRKVLILVTDGFQDDPYLPQNNLAPERGPFDYTACQHFKDPVSAGGLGYEVYVVYTPYYPIPHNAYLQFGWAQYAQQNGPGSIPYNLQACSSQGPTDPAGTYYVSALSETDLRIALLNFLAQALKSPARYTE